MIVPTQQVKDLTLSDKDENNCLPAYFQLHSFPEERTLIASLQPPKEPSIPVHHVPCDIVLVIDVSGTMNHPAPVPGDSSSETNGFSVLDLVKHAALMIVETMDERDRLSIVTFASDVHVLQPLEYMTKANKMNASENVKSMRPLDRTNLWQGILTGLNQFGGVDSNGKVPAVIVLTDGLPNHMCPAAGYIPKLRNKLPLPATVYTFGFGCALKSGLLMSIAEIGNGNYSFISDSGMIGTNFVHAVAHLQSTYATEATLQLKYDTETRIEEAMGTSVLSSPPTQFFNSVGKPHMQLDIPLGNLQYGQSRDIVLRFPDPGPWSIVEATIRYKPVLQNGAGNYASATVSHNLMVGSTMPKEAVAYHQSRALLCYFLSSLFPVKNTGEHAVCLESLDQVNQELKALIETIPARNFPDPRNMSLMQDLIGEEMQGETRFGKEPEGQIAIALRDKESFKRWGQHYLLSLLNAHKRQICNSFKDPGPLQYGRDSPLFIACRDRLDNIFDNLESPAQSLARRHGNDGLHVIGVFAEAGSMSMSSYRNSSGVCFAASTLVQLASGRSIEMQHVRRGMKLRTPLGSRKVVAVLQTPVTEERLCRVGAVLVTPWHPISLDGKAWTFPALTAHEKVRYTGSVYSVMLQRGQDPAAHALRLDGLWGVTLGHGLTTPGDARAHAFFGNCEAVRNSLLGLAVVRRGEFISSGVRRNPQNGQVCSFEQHKSRDRVLSWRRHLTRDGALTRSKRVRAKSILRS